MEILFYCQNHPLLPIRLSLSFVSSANVLKSIFTPSSLIFVCLAISSPPFSLVSSLNAQTASALLFSSHSILSLLESHVSVYDVFLDLKKAFDSVPHQPLLDLLSSLNLPPHLLNWIHSYLLTIGPNLLLSVALLPPPYLFPLGFPRVLSSAPSSFLYTSMALLTSPSLFPLTYSLC